MVYETSGLWNNIILIVIPIGYRNFSSILRALRLLLSSTCDEDRLGTF